MTSPWPTELRLHKDRKALTVAFESGESFDLAAQYLRIRSPSAEVQGHSPSERRTVGGKEAGQILEVHPVGNYAVRLMFDDMHSTGIFVGNIFSNSVKIAKNTGRTISTSLRKLALRVPRRRIDGTALVAATAIYILIA